MTVLWVVLVRAGYADVLALEDAGWHSYIVTENGRVKDTAFATMLSTALGGTGIGAHYDDLVVALGECYGGGMLDELKPFATMSATSASQWNERSYSLDGPVNGRKGAYLNAWANAVNTPAKPNMLDAFNTANANDPAGPKKKTYQEKYGAKYLEHPQYISSSSIGDGIKLRDSTPAFAILYGGSSVNPKSPWTNYNSLVQMHDVLINRYGYAEDDIYALYPGAKTPDGKALPAWIRSRAKTADLEAAFTWLKNKAGNGTPDVFYWNSQQHGARAKDLAAAPGAGGVNFGLDSAYVSDYFDTTPGLTDDRFLHLEYSGLGTGEQLFLNGTDLGLLPSGDQSFDLPLDPALVPVFTSSNLLSLSSGTFDDFSSLQIGIDAAGEMPVPEPASMALLAIMLCSLLVLQRRRKAARQPQPRLHFPRR